MPFDRAERVTPFDHGEKGDPKHVHYSRIDHSHGESPRIAWKSLPRIGEYHGVDIVAFQSIPWEKTLLMWIVVDKPEAAKTLLDKEGITHTEVKVAQARIQYRPSELARVASKPAEANININYAYRIAIIRVHAVYSRTAFCALFAGRASRVFNMSLWLDSPRLHQCT
jgi:hypothetical protein